MSTIMIEVDPILITLKDIKQEGECCFCFSKEDLFSMLEPYNFEENVEIYSTMIADCFQIQLSLYIEEFDRNRYLICKNCVYRLRDAIMFRSQIKIAYDRLQAEFNTKRDHQGDISSECSNLSDTKEHVMKYGISDCDDNTQRNMNVNPGASSSNENILKLKPLKILLAKNDNSTKKKRPTLNKHKDLHTNGKTCEYCNKTFKTNTVLLRHQKIHLNVKDFICDYCKREFVQKSSLHDHILLHMDIKNMKCDLCDKCFVSKKILSKHQRMSHSVGISCTICNKTFSSQRTFEDHALMHSGPSNHMCEMCGTTFPTSSMLDRHKILHTNKKTCKFCNKEFKTNQILLRHEKIHLDIKDFICDYCKRNFRHKWSLQNHILLHLGIKDEKCDLCGKGFVTKTNLLRHKRSFH